MNSDLNYFEINQIFENRSKNVLEEFERSIYSGITNKDILRVLEKVFSYWKGKRGSYRPALISFSAESVGGNPEDTLNVGLMVTLAGAGVGIHDDITDRSKRKHWENTVFGIYGINDSLIVGDLLIVKGLATVKEVVQQIGDEKKIFDVIQTYQDFFSSSYEGMFMEKKCIKNPNVEINYYFKILEKYASDIQACTKLGAILGNATNEQVNALSIYGKQMGFAYRLFEDIKDTLNVEGSLMNRIKNESLPLPILYASKESDYNSLKLDKILKGPIDKSIIEPVIDMCFDAGSFHFMLDLVKKKVEKGTAILSFIDESRAKNILKQLIESQQGYMISLYEQFGIL